MIDTTLLTLSHTITIEDDLYHKDSSMPNRNKKYAPQMGYFEYNKHFSKNESIEDSKMSAHAMNTQQVNGWDVFLDVIGRAENNISTLAGYFPLHFDMDIENMALLTNEHIQDNSLHTYVKMVVQMRV